MKRKQNKLSNSEETMFGSNSRSSKKLSASNRSSSSLNEKSINKLFDTIAEPNDSDKATMEGLCKLCEELSLDPYEDIQILVLLWKMGCGKAGEVSRQDWVNGCQHLKLDTIEKFRKVVPSLDPGFLDQSEFRELYKYCFQFNLTGTHRSLDKATVVALLGITLKNRISEQRISSITEFLNTSQESAYNTITLDQWMSFYDFSLKVHDLSTYDESMSAWPTIIDDFVDYEKSMKV